MKHNKIALYRKNKKVNFQIILEIMKNQSRDNQTKDYLKIQTPHNNKNLMIKKIK